MEWFKKKRKQQVPVVQTAVSDGYNSSVFSLLGKNGQIDCERRLYQSLRDSVPVIDAAISKLVRLTGHFYVHCQDGSLEKQLNRFLETVRVNGCQYGAESFLQNYLSQLITFGTAVGEMVMAENGREIAALYNASLDDVELQADKNPFAMTICAIAPSGERIPVRYPSLVLCSTIMNRAGELYGTSVLKGLPFVGDVMMKILYAIGTNWDRIGNVRFAVSYKPGDNDRSFTRERASQIAAEWSKAMKSREPKDFVTVGDVSIRAIGADNQVPEIQVPMRALLEQILSKLSIPPFLLGFSWSATERMSAQQADILTSELEYYRSVLTGVIKRICDLWLRLRGQTAEFTVEWDNINLQDEVELARARLLNAQADQITAETQKGDR